MVNAQRAAHGRPNLHESRLLRVAARRYARLMVRRRFFSHNALSMIRRLHQSNYLRAARHWSLGENIAWGSGASAEPPKIVDAWMASPPHRRNILSPEFRHAGIGIAAGAPVAGLDGRTYVLDFGARRR